MGVIGLGIIGSRVAQNLSRAGASVWVWNRTPKPFPGFVGGPSDVAARADIVSIYVKDGPAVLECIRQMLPALSPRHIVLNHATVHPDDAIEAGKLVESKGAGFLDAPFTGSRDAAAENKLVYYAGGNPQLIERARPFLMLSARDVLTVGGVGDASLIKVLTNMVTASIVSSLSEALALVEAKGLPGTLLADAIGGNAARSGVSDLKLPAMLARDFDPRFSLDNMAKDMRIAERLLSQAGVPARSVGAFLEHAKAAADRGLSPRDFSVIVETCRADAHS